MKVKRTHTRPDHFVTGHFKTQKAGDNRVVIEGFANKAVVDRGNDLIPPSAWEKGLDNFKKNPIILFNHHPDQMVGRATDIKATEEGLYIRAEISSSDDEITKRVRNLVKDDVLKAFSVGFDSKEQDKDENGINVIKAADLFEVSIVGIPMNQDSLFTVIQKGTHENRTSKKSVMEELDSIEKRVQELEIEEKPKVEDDSEDSSESKIEEEKQSKESKGEETQDQPESELKLLVEGRSGESGGHRHKFQLESQNGDGVTTSTEGEVDVADHRHEIKDFEMQPSGEDGHTHTVPSIERDSKPVEEKDGGCADQKQAEQETMTLPSEPINTEAKQDENPHILLAQQTNVLLGQLIGEIQGLRSDVLNKVEPQPGEELEEEQSEEISESKPDEEQDKENLETQPEEDEEDEKEKKSVVMSKDNDQLLPQEKIANIETEQQRDKKLFDEFIRTVDQRLKKLGA